MEKFIEAKRIIAESSEVEKRAIYYSLAESYGEALPGISKTKGVCGGSACIRNLRLSLFLLEQLRQSGESDAYILEAYPDLTEEDLVNAWAYVHLHREEIQNDIEENERA